jgi:hypothetical protein
VKAGILKQPNQENLEEKKTIEPQAQQTEFTNPKENNTQQRQVTWEDTTMDTSRSANSSLSRSVTNSKITSVKKDIDAKIESLKNNFEQ